MLKENIRRIAKEKGLTFSEIEKECKIQQGYLSKWDRHKPSIERVSRVANFLGVTIEELLVPVDEEVELEG